MTGFLIVIAIILFILGLFFYLLGFPVWMIVDCATSQKLDTKAKTIWITLMVITWPLAGIVYGLAKSGKRVIQAFSVGGLALVLAMIMLIMWAIPQVRQEAVEVAGKLQTQIETSDVPSTEIRLQVIEDLGVLQEEVEDTNFRNLERADRAVNLMRLLLQFLEDGRLAVEEYEDWHAKFKDRDLLDDEAFKGYVNRMKSDSS